MTNQKKTSFQASDAFAYVDTYRSLILNDGSYIESEKKRLEEKIWNMNMVPSRLQAELQAHDHALAKVMDGKEPGTVAFGGDGESGDEDASSAEAARAYMEQAKELKTEVDRLTAKLRTAAAQEQELQAEVVRKNQEINRLRRKLEQTYSSIYVVSATFGVIVLVLLAIRFLN